MVSLYDGELCVQRGVQKKIQTAVSDVGEHGGDQAAVHVVNFLGLLSKAQIVAALKEAGLTGAASDAEKMKKGDAASHAEQWLSGSRWVPGWMQSPDAAKPDDAHAAPDTDEPTSHAA